MGSTSARLVADRAGHISVWELIPSDPSTLWPVRELRTGRLLARHRSPLANRGAAEIDMLCVRENSEGEYAAWAAACTGYAQEVAEQTGIFTRHGIERIARYAFKLAQTRPRKMLASATKSNALQHAMVLWDEVVAGVATEFPDVELRSTTWTRCARA
jgi:isocitrate/isopropylmalate dehydrogenase